MAGRELPIVGWGEYVDLPDWGVRGLRAKIDTGARSSALHVENLVELPKRRVRFDVVLDSGRHKNVEARVRRRGRVRSSNGQYEERIFIMARLRIGPEEFDAEVSLVDRHKMVYRMLVGRTALAGRFLVNSARRSLLTRAPRRKVSKKKRR